MDASKGDRLKFSLSRWANRRHTMAAELRPQPVSLPEGTRLVCFSLDLEPDFGGRTGTAEVFGDRVHFDRWAEVVRRYDLKLTVFVVGNLLDRPPEETDHIVERLADLGAEFELHAYTHDLSSRADQAEEIRRGKAAFRRRFGRDPLGYRAPQGRISARELMILAAEGFAYDSSIFPSLRPGVFNNLRFPAGPSYLAGPAIVEFPVAVVPRVRLPVALSYIKLLGPSAYRLLSRVFGLPPVLVFVLHLHDLFPVASLELLPARHRLKWLRNRERGIEVFEGFVRHIVEMGYQSLYMSDLLERARHV